MARRLRPQNERELDIKSCFVFWPWENADTTRAGRRALIKRMENACRRERGRGLAGSFAYDTSRHTAMLAVLKIERAELALLERIAAP